METSAVTLWMVVSDVLGTGDDEEEDRSLLITTALADRWKKKHLRTGWLVGWFLAVMGVVVLVVVLVAAAAAAVVLLVKP